MGCRHGVHNVLLLGPPGAGKSMLARRLTTILPAMSLAEALETTRIPHVAGLTGERTACITTRPFRAPHHVIPPCGKGFPFGTRLQLTQPPRSLNDGSASRPAAPLCCVEMTIVCRSVQIPNACRVHAISGSRCSPGLATV